MEAMNPAEIVVVIKDVVVTVAAGLAAYVGIRGLSTWRRQLSGNAEYLLAKNILACVFEVRDRAQDIRNSLISYSAEPNLPKEKLENLSREEKEWHGLVQAYEKQWEPIRALQVRLYSYLWEAEAVFEKDIAAKGRELVRMMGKLKWAIESELRDTRPAQKNGRQVSQDLLKRRHQILYGGDEDDDFKKQVEIAVAFLETELGRYIKAHYRS